MGRLLSFCSRPHPRFGALSAVIEKLRRGKFLDRRMFKGACRCCTIMDYSSFGGGALGKIVDGCFGGSCLKTISSLIGRRRVSLSRLGRLVQSIRGTRRWSKWERWLGVRAVKTFFMCVMGSTIYLTMFCLFCHLLLDHRAFRHFGHVTLLKVLVLSYTVPFIRIAVGRPVRIDRRLLA